MRIRNLGVQALQVYISSTHSPSHLITHTILSSSVTRFVFWKVLLKNSCKSSPNICHCLVYIFWKTSYLKQNCCSYFGHTLGEIGLLWIPSVHTVCDAQTSPDHFFVQSLILAIFASANCCLSIVRWCTFLTNLRRSKVKLRSRSNPWTSFYKSTSPFNKKLRRSMYFENYKMSSKLTLFYV